MNHALMLKPEGCPCFVEHRFAWFGADAADNQLAGFALGVGVYDV
jgi:hypothetical protein